MTYDSTRDRLLLFGGNGTATTTTICGRGIPTTQRVDADHA